MNFVFSILAILFIGFVIYKVLNKTSKHLKQENINNEISGNKINQSINNDDKKTIKSFLIMTLFGGFLLLFAFLSLINIIFTTPTDNSTDSATSSNDSYYNCKPYEQTAIAIEKYKSSGIITRIESQYNTVYVSQSSWDKVMENSDKELLGWVVGCYCSYKRGNTQIHSTIYSEQTGNKLAKYSRAYGIEY